MLVAIGHILRDVIKMTTMAQIKRNSELKYIRYLAQLNITPMWDIWTGVGFPHMIKCEYGHITSPRPVNVTNIHRKHNGCTKCTGNNTELAEVRFINLLSSYGCIPMWSFWNGSTKSNQIMCINGHINDVIPHRIMSTNAKPCECYCYNWDILYVLINEINNTFKFGITSKNERRRINENKRDGYTKLIVLIKNINAKYFEDIIKNCLKNAGFVPVRGDEYFSNDALFIVIQLLESYAINRIDNL